MLKGTVHQVSVQEMQDPKMLGKLDEILKTERVISLVGPTHSDSLSALVFKVLQQTGQPVEVVGITINTEYGSLATFKTVKETLNSVKKVKLPQVFVNILEPQSMQQFLQQDVELQHVNTITVTIASLMR